MYPRHSTQCTLFLPEDRQHEHEVAKEQSTRASLSSGTRLEESMEAFSVPFRAVAVCTVYTRYVIYRFQPPTVLLSLSAVLGWKPFETCPHLAILPHNASFFPRLHLSPDQNVHTYI